MKFEFDTVIHFLKIFMSVSNLQTCIHYFHVLVHSQYVKFRGNASIIEKLLPSIEMQRLPYGKKASSSFSFFGWPYIEFGQKKRLKKTFFGHHLS